MPTYDYACKACGHAFEHFQPMGDKLLRTCPDCGKRQLERLIGSGAGIVFRGSGFYETDYKRKPRKDEAAAGDSGEKAPAKTADGKTGQPAADTSSAGPSTSGGKPTAGDTPAPASKPGGKD